MRHVLLAATAAAAIAPAAHAQIDSIRLGVMQHNICVIDCKNADKESGPNVATEVRFKSPEFLGWAGSPHPYLMASVNTQGNTSYGGAGLDMFEGIGYAPSLDSRVSNQASLGFEFGTRERDDSIAALMEQIPRLVYSAPGEGLVFDEMFATHCNLSPAHAEIHKEAVARLRDLQELEVVRPSKKRVTTAKIQGSDLIRRPAQTWMKL